MKIELGGEVRLQTIYMKQLSTWTLIPFALICGSFMAPQKEVLNEIKELRSQVVELQTQIVEDRECHDEELSELRAQNESMARFVSDPINLVKMLYSRKRNLQNTMKKEGKFVGTNLNLRHKGIDTRISPTLYAAFLDCTGPTVDVNSAVRHTNHHSQHYTGEALDIRYDENGVSFAHWLVSKEGTEWRNRFGISFYVEDSYSKSAIFKDLNGPKFEPFHFVNRGATGPHLHLYLERRNEKKEKTKDRRTTSDL